MTYKTPFSNFILQNPNFAPKSSNFVRIEPVQKSLDKSQFG